MEKAKIEKIMEIAESVGFGTRIIFEEKIVWHGYDLNMLEKFYDVIIDNQTSSQQ